MEGQGPLSEEMGLHGVRFEEVFPGQRRSVATSFLRLQRQGEAGAFRVEPEGLAFGPGSVLYFHAERTARSTAFTSEVAYELGLSREGAVMGTLPGTPQGGAVVTSSLGTVSLETNQLYQSGLLEADDVWLWEAMTPRASRTKSFTLSGVDAASGEGGGVVVFLQGGSEWGAAVDHHVRVWVNGIEVGETSFAGERPHRMEAVVPASVVREGANEMQVLLEIGCVRKKSSLIWRA